MVWAGAELASPRMIASPRESAFAFRWPSGSACSFAADSSIEFGRIWGTTYLGMLSGTPSSVALPARHFESEGIKSRNPAVLTNGQLFDLFSANAVTEARCLWHAYRSRRADLNFRLDDIFVPIPLARRDISRQYEPRKCRHGNIVGAPDTRFQHSPAPHRNRMLHTQVMYLLGPSMSPHSSQLNINDPAGAQLDRRFCMGGIVNALIQANGRS